MKKIIIASMLVCAMGVSGADFCGAYNMTASAATTTTATTSTNWDSEASLKRVNTIGQKILKANNLPTTITFKVSDDESINAYANIDKEVYVYRGLLEYVENDFELAGVIAHELGHIVNGHCAKQTLINTAVSSLQPNLKSENANTSLQAAQTLSLLKITRSDEFEADRTAVDLMVKTGYTPLALISVLNKICGNYIDILETHPSGEKRLMNIYDYTNYNYPEKIKIGYTTDSYKKALTVINANLEERNASPRKLKKVQKEQEKYKKQQLKRAKRVAKSTNPWEQSYAVLQIMSATQQ